MRRWSRKICVHVCIYIVIHMTGEPFGLLSHLCQKWPIQVKSDLYKRPVQHSPWYFQISMNRKSLFLIYKNRPVQYTYKNRPVYLHKQSCKSKSTKADL